ncbi:MAG TPA: FAD-dependent oxidoreductase [Thermoguttaceae bacterium]|nr:FAD-dependent oxidoreductase [Thermoguttaceae bacterium]
MKPIHPTRSPWHLDFSRRKFLGAAALGAVTAPHLASGADNTAAMAAEVSTEEKRSLEKAISTDVLVIGGGTAGTIAAIQAARIGAKTLLVERGSQLGGTMTVGGVAFPGLFHAWGKQVISGIGWDLVRQTVELDGGRLPDFTTPAPPGRHWVHQVLINPFLYAVLAEEACRLAGVEVCYYEFPVAAQPAQDGWRVEVVGPGTRRHVTCKQLIDCSGGADVVGMLGLERLREDETQPGSMLFKLGDTFQAGRERLESVYVHGADSSNSVSRTQANLAGRRAVLERLRTQRARGDQGARLVQLQPEAAFRESYRILGEVVIMHEDYVGGRVFDDAVCYAFYPVDLHTRQGVRPQPLKEGIVPTVPLRALIPKGSRNLMVAGRSVSSDRLANSGLRVQATCMAMGQAAGAAAALAARRNFSPQEVPLAELKALLRQHGAITP